MMRIEKMLLQVQIIANNEIPLLLCTIMISEEFLKYPRGSCFDEHLVFLSVLINFINSQFRAGIHTVAYTITMTICNKLTI